MILNFRVLRFIIITNKQVLTRLMIITYISIDRNYWNRLVTIGMDRSSPPVTMENLNKQQVIQAYETYVELLDV